MYYDVIPIKTAIVNEGHTELIPDSIDYTVKALVKILEAKKGVLSELPTSYNDYVGFELNTETDRGEINGIYSFLMADLTFNKKINHMLYQ